MITEFDGFEEDVYTFLELPNDISIWVKATWACFTNNIEKFRVGCDIIFAPSQIILSDDNRLAFYAEEVVEMKYVGEEHKASEHRNTVRMVCSRDVHHNFYARIYDYFKAKLPNVKLQITGFKGKES